MNIKGIGHKPLKDEDRMPFGKWENERMIDVPSSYLMFLWNNIVDPEGGGVAAYIRANLERIQKEHQDEVEEKQDE